MRLRRQVGVVVLILVMAGLAAPRSARGVVPAGPKDQPVQLAGETALILWAESSDFDEPGTEHLILRPSFVTEAKSFCFLVPTPKKPTVADVSAEVFTALGRMTEPKVVKRPRLS